MQRLKPADVMIAGGGFVGLTLAKEITARTSLSVVVLERGQPRRLADSAAGMDELDYALRYRMMQNDGGNVFEGPGRMNTRCRRES